jgi:hypothetical protein
VFCVILNVFRLIKSRRMRWTGHVICMGEMRNGFWLESLKGRDHLEHLEDVGIDRRIILKWILWK